MPIYLRPTILLSAVIGAILGIVSLIPLLNMFVFIPFCLIGGLIVFLLKKNNVVGILTINEGAIIGAISGAIAFIACSVVFVPLSLALGVFIKSYITSTLISGTSLMITSFNILVLVMLVGFVAMLFALFSAFSGLIAAFIYEKLEAKEVAEEIPEFKIDY